MIDLGEVFKNAQPGGLIGVILHALGLIGKGGGAPMPFSLPASKRTDPMFAPKTPRAVSSPLTPKPEETYRAPARIKQVAPT